MVRTVLGAIGRIPFLYQTQQHDANMVAASGWKMLPMEGWVECAKCSLHVMEEDARSAPCPRCGAPRLKEDDCPTPKMEMEETEMPLVLFRLFSQCSGPDPSLILGDFLFLGSMFGVQTRSKLIELEKSFLQSNPRSPGSRGRVVNILNMAVEIEDKFPVEFHYKKIPLEDDENQDIRSHFEETSEWIERARVKGELVIVHCAAGVSRSATIVLAYLMSKERMKLKDAFAFVKKKRPVISPNSGFLFQLWKYEEELFGENSISVRELTPRLLQK